jgi:hypothetical protein
MTDILSADLLTRYARPPSDATASRAISTHESVRGVLGDTEYATLLQGSYKNDTALWEMNDVDIVAVSRNLVSRAFSGTTGGDGVAWPEIFARVERKLQSDARYAGRWTREDKCIRLNTEIKIDIVPAVRIADAAADPISIYSFRAAQERRNWPRGHYEAGARKSGLTSGAYKQTVRLFKRWTRCWFSDRKIAPSYYVECLVHAQQPQLFTGNLARDFVALGGAMVLLQYGTSALPRLCGEGNLFSADEWAQTPFGDFQRVLRAALSHAQAALGARTDTQARAYWVAAFNGQQSA